MEFRHWKSAAALLAVGLWSLWNLTAWAQQSSYDIQVPSNFNLDMETAARLRPQFMAQSIPAAGRYATGRLVLENLVQQVDPPRSLKLTWQLRIVEDEEFNAYTSPDGTIFVENGLAQLAGPSAGLWAAILSHEIAHVVRRDWARRYLYQRSLENGSAATIVLGDPGTPSGSWSDSHEASAELGRFCRQMEVDADRDGLMLMARAGYHPDFVPALHHLLHAQSSGDKTRSLYAMHPCWEERDHELSAAYAAASSEFEHRWQEWYASPGGNPPIVVFTEEPKLRRTGGQWEIRIPMRCQNLAGAVEVVLHAGSRTSATREHLSQSTAESDDELRQLTGCTSPKTTITFTLSNPTHGRRSNAQWTDIYVLDAWGAVLARADLPKLAR